MEKENPNYYAVLEAQVRYDNRLRANAKLLYAEITALSNKYGYCFASNKYLANLYGATNRAIQIWLKQLTERGYIRMEMVDDYKRKIFLVQGGMNKSVGGYEQNYIHNTISNTTHNKKDFLVKKSSLKVNKKKNMDYVEVDEDGNELVNGWGRKKGEAPKTGKNKIALRLQHKFADLVSKNCGTKPVMNMAGYKLVLYALNTGGLTEEQIVKLFEWWISQGKPTEETIQITRALSANSINIFKVQNGIK